MSRRVVRHGRACKELFERALVATLVTAMLLLGCPPSNAPLSPLAGVAEFQEIGFVPVPGPAMVNVAGGNFAMPRTDLSIETQLGKLEVGAVWNSATRKWHFNFDHPRYVGGTFVDATGLSMSIVSLPANSPIPGTHWVKLDGTTIETKGGLRYEFGADGRLRTMRWASSPEPKLVFDVANGPDGQPHTQSIRQCVVGGVCGTVYSFQYDANGRPTGVTDRAGRTAAYHWDGSGRLSVARDGLDMASGWPGTRYVYSLAGDLAAITTSEGERVEYTFSSQRLAEVRQIGGAAGTLTRRFYYEGKNEDQLRVTRYVDATTRETRFRYDDSRRIREIETAAAGDTSILAWWGMRPTSLTRPDGTTTRWTYDQDDIATRTDPSGNVTEFQYDRAAVDRQRPFQTPVTAIEDHRGVFETRTYDAQGRLTTIENAVDDTLTVTYGADEMVASVTLPSAVVVQFADYGQHGQSTRVIVDEQSYPYAYDLVGNLRSGEAPILGFEEGGVIAREYDADRNLARVLVADYWAAMTPRLEEPEVVQISYRSDHRPLAIRRPRGGDHEFQYDAFGRQTARREKVDGSWATTTRGYDSEGRPVSLQLPNGMARGMSYDAAGRPSAVTFRRHAVSEGSLTFHYAAGRIASVDDSTRGTETYDYDAAGRVSQVHFADGEHLAFGYDERSRVTNETFWMPNWVPLRTISRRYDLAGRQHMLLDGSTSIVLRLFGGGKLTHELFANRLTRSYAYGPELAELTGSSTVETWNQSQTIETTSIERSIVGPAFGAPIQFTEATTTTSVGAAATTAEAYGLAPFVSEDIQLETAHQGKRLVMSGPGIPWALPNASYDSLSNETDHGVYNAEVNRLLTHQYGARTTSYTYDAAGFVASRNGQPVTWTALGLLASHGPSTTLSWDLQGRLVSTTVNGITTRFRFGGRVEADAGGNPVAIDLGNVRIGLDGSGRRYRHSDFRGNVKFITNDAGEVVSHYRYDPYGVAEIIGDTSDPIRFVGGRQIGDLALLGARVLDPASGRFLSQDPILNLLNQYTYTSGNPIWFSDPTGLASAASGVLYALGVGIGAAGLLVGAATMTPVALGASVAFFLGVTVLGSGILLGGGAGVARPSAPPPPDSGPPGGTGPGPTIKMDLTIAIEPPGTVAPVVCAPTEWSRVPDVGWALAVLGPLQLILGAALIMRRRRSLARCGREVKELIGRIG